MISNYTIGMIYAADEEGGIGKRGVIPWRHRGDSEHFWGTIADKPVIVGTNTYKKAEKYFLDRRGLFPNTMVLSRRASYSIVQNPLNLGMFYANVTNTVDIVNTMDRLVKDTDGRVGEAIWVCGGAQVYEALLPHTDIIVETNICGSFDCDAFMPWKTAVPPRCRSVSSFPVPSTRKDILTAYGEVFAKDYYSDADVRFHMSNLGCLDLLGVSVWR